MDQIPPLPLKPLRWVGPSLEELKEFPEPVRKDMGHALFEAQAGGKADSAKPLGGFGGAGVLEIVENYDGNTYRAVYTVRLAGIIYVLHCFQKKSNQGVKTPKPKIDLVNERLRRAVQKHRETYPE